MAVQVFQFMSLLLLFSMMYGVRSATINAIRLDAADIVLPTSQAGIGVVEVFVIPYNNWLPVCSSSSWNNSAESRVLCRQLGFNTTCIPATDRAVLPSNRLSLDFNFECSGAESELTECSYQFLNESTSCYPVIVSCTPCTEGGVLLYNGTSPIEGTVEYCRDGFWRAICDINWSYQNSFVVCRELGLPATAAIPHLSLYHPFPLVAYFNCIGNESSLADCYATGTLLCNSENVAGVKCIGEMVAGCTDDDIRLIGGRDQNEGRVEICSNGVWGTIYHGGSWDYRHATVVCRQLGYQFERGISYQGGLLGPGSGPILFAYLYCNGRETSLSECQALRSVPFGTGHFNDVGVRCFNASHSDCSYGDVRLVNGSNMFEGRVEFCYNGMWGSICDNAWDNKDAAIVCQQLQFSNNRVIAVSGSYFGDGEGPYFVSSTYCGEPRNYYNRNDRNDNLRFCSRVGIHDYTSECSPGHDAGVICEVCSHGDVRLQNRRAEVCVNGIWASICKDDIDHSTISNSVCKQVLEVEQSFYVQNCSQEGGAVTPVLYDLSCTEESRFIVRDCTFNISHSTAECDSVLSIECYPQSNCTEGALRLIDGTSQLDGRVEICISGFWGVLPGPPPYYPLSGSPISSADFNQAEDFCRQLKLPWEWALPYRIAGDYPQLLSCGSASEHCYQPRCSWGSAFGMICQGNSSKPKECEHLDVRLVDGSKETEGRLEICAHGYWSNVCVDTDGDYHGVLDYWNRYAAVLVCRKLGYPTEVALHNLHGAPFGSSPMLPVVKVDCGYYYHLDPYRPAPIPDDIDQCHIVNQSDTCSRERTIIGISCEANRGYYNITVEVLPAQESYEIGTEVTLRCLLPPSLQRFPSVRVCWSTLVADVLPFSDDDNSSTPNISFVIPANHPASANYNCSVRGTLLRGNVLLATEGTTIKIKVSTAASSRLSGLFISGSVSGAFIAIVLIIMTIIIM